MRGGPGGGLFLMLFLVVAIFAGLHILFTIVIPTWREQRVRQAQRDAQERIRLKAKQDELDGKREVYRQRIDALDKHLDCILPNPKLYKEWLAEYQEKDLSVGPISQKNWDILVSRGWTVQHVKKINWSPSIDDRLKHPIPLHNSLRPPKP